MDGGKLIGKFEPKWEGPYIVEKVYGNGTHEVTNCESQIKTTINENYLKRYYL